MIGAGGEAAVPELPEACVAEVLSLTTPRDACRLSAVCTTFRAAADSDHVWARFLPSPPPPLPPLAGDGDGEFDEKRKSSSRVKELFFRLCDRPALLPPDNRLCMWVDRWSGGKCFMLSARALSIVWGDTPQYWRWIPHSDSRFAEVAELLNIMWLEINGKIDTRLLSRRTAYGVYFVYKLIGLGRTFSFQPQVVTVSADNQVSQSTVILAPDGDDTRRNTRMFRSYQDWSGVMTCPQQHFWEADYGDEGAGARHATPVTRRDGWLEIEMGSFFNGEEAEGDVKMSLTEVKGQFWKRGLILHGIEIRPKRKL